MARTPEQTNLERSIDAVVDFINKVRELPEPDKIPKKYDAELAVVISSVVKSIVGQVARSIEDVSYDHTQELLERLAPGGVPLPAVVLWGFLREPLDKNNYR